MKRLALLFGLGLTLNSFAAPMQWGDLRDGSLYLQANRPDTVKVRWVPAWQAEANEEHIYLLDGQGKLQGERLIKASETRGLQSWPLVPGAASYRLEIPGYSFRSYRVEHDDKTVALFSPAKVHFSVETGNGDELFFQVAPGEHAVLNGKYHGGVNALQAQRMDDGQQLSLALKPYRAYWQFDQVALPVSDQPQVWRMRLQGSGKAAFWLDGTANLFAQNPQQLQPLREEPGQVRLTLHDKVLGRTPDLGIALPNLMPPATSYAALDALKPSAASYYSYVDVTSKNTRFADPVRQLYQTRFGIRQDITLLAGTGRRADLRADVQSNNGLEAWLAGTRALEGQGTHYIGFADEPNLNYSSYEDYRAIFVSMARQVRSDPANAKAGVRIAMPASSRFVNGPFARNAADKRGIDWARRLLSESADQVDALAWHEWMIRDLLATRVYRDSVRRAADLVGLDANGQPRKALLLDQTNLSSGSALSPYDQETHYTALWWASVVINASQDGLLSMLNWFQAADEPPYGKGMVRIHDDGRFELKPVGLAQQFIARHWLPQVLQLDNDAFEVDVLAMAGDEQRALLGVNKGTRLQRVDLSGARCPLNQSALRFFGADNRSRDIPFACENGRVRFDLPGQTVFALNWSAS